MSLAQPPATWPPGNEAPFPGDDAPARTVGAAGVQLGGRYVRAAGGRDGGERSRCAVELGEVEPICDAAVNCVRDVEPHPRFVVVGTPGHVDPRTGNVTGAANLGGEWTGTVPLRQILSARLECEVEIRNDAEMALEAERRHGALVSANDGALITMSTGLGVALLVDGRIRPTELGHSVLQYQGPPCQGRPHAGCFETFLGGWALPLRYKEFRPDFDGVEAYEIPDDVAFWSDCGERLGELIVTLCLLGQQLEVVSIIGSVARGRAHLILPPALARIHRESGLLLTVPRQVQLSPLGEDGIALGALELARFLLFPFETI